MRQAICSFLLSLYLYGFLAAILTFLVFAFNLALLSESKLDLLYVIAASFKVLFYCALLGPMHASNLRDKFGLPPKGWETKALGEQDFTMLGED